MLRPHEAIHTNHSPDAAAKLAALSLLFYCLKPPPTHSFPRVHVKLLLALAGRGGGRVLLLLLLLLLVAVSEQNETAGGEGVRHSCRVRGQGKGKGGCLWSRGSVAALCSNRLQHVGGQRQHPHVLRCTRPPLPCHAGPFPSAPLHLRPPRTILTLRQSLWRRLWLQLLRRHRFSRQPLCDCEDGPKVRAVLHLPLGPAA